MSELNDLDQYYLNAEEPLRSCLFALRDIILSIDEKIIPAWKFGGPFFCFENKILCYLWVDKKKNQPYLAMYKGHLIDHPLLESEGRAMIKVMRFNADEDLPIEAIQAVLQSGLDIYKEPSSKRTAKNGKK